jgi:hypothetical protein
VLGHAPRGVKTDRAVVYPLQLVATAIVAADGL